jgi:hypothetical protein
VYWWLADVFEGECPVLEFEVATWSERFESFANHVFGVFEAGEESPAVDVVKFFGEFPFVFCVFDFETAIGWDTVFLVRRWLRGWSKGGGYECDSTGLRSVPTT